MEVIHVFWLWGWDVRCETLRLDLTEDVKHNDDTYVDETDHHDCIGREFQSVDVFRKECKLVSLVVLRPTLHVG